MSNIDNIFNSKDIIDTNVEVDVPCSMNGKRYMFYVCGYLKTFVHIESSAFRLWKSRLNRRLDIAHEITEHSDVSFLKLGDDVPKPLQNWLYGKFNTQTLYANAINPYFFGIDVHCRNLRDTQMIVWSLFKAMHCPSEFWIIEPREGYGDSIYFHDIRLTYFEAKAYRAEMKRRDYHEYGITHQMILSPHFVEMFLKS